MKLKFSLFFVMFCSATMAQRPIVNTTQYKIIYRDTINIRGIVLDADGKPVPDVLVTSRSKEIRSLEYHTYAFTDMAGRFEIKGALPVDTLTVSAYNQITVINNKSRYLQIHLPARVLEYDQQPVVVTATATKPKTMPAFKVLDGIILAGYLDLDFPHDAIFPGGIAKFREFINKTVVYPSKAIENNIEGEVEIGFTVTRSGDLVNFRIIRGIGYGCDEAAVAAAKQSPKWSPASLFGRGTIPQDRSVIVNFKLIDPNIK